MFSMIGIIVGLVFKPKGGNKVIKFLPDDKRFLFFDIAKEYAFSVRCKLKKGYPVQRFIKLSSGWSGFWGTYLKKAATLFLGVQGTAFTFPIQSGDVKKDYTGEVLTVVKVLKGVWGEEYFDQIPSEQIDLLGNTPINILANNERTTLDLYLKNLWGKEFYKQISPERRADLLDGKVNVIIGLGDPPKTEDLGKKKRMSEEDLKTEEDKAASETFWLGRKIMEKGAWIQWMFIFGSGMGAALFLQVIGILKI